MMARGIAILTGLAWIRVSLSYLGKEGYGLWMAVGSLVGWANLADLGLTRGMQNHLSQANGQDDKELAARYVSTGLAAMTGVAFVLALLSTPVVLSVPWTRVLNVRDPNLVEEARSVVAAVLACFLLQFPLSLVPTMYAAYQRGYIDAMFSVLGSVLSLGALIVITRVQVSLPGLILVTGGTGILKSLLNRYASRARRDLRGRLRFPDRCTPDQRNAIAHHRAPTGTCPGGRVVRIHARPRVGCHIHLHDRHSPHSGFSRSVRARRA
jgi:O-antigen/teichoic acid export membrane protein